MLFWLHPPWRLLHRHKFCVIQCTRVTVPTTLRWLGQWYTQFHRNSSLLPHLVWMKSSSPGTHYHPKYHWHPKSHIFSLQRFLAHTDPGLECRPLGEGFDLWGSQWFAPQTPQGPDLGIRTQQSAYWSEDDKNIFLDHIEAQWIECVVAQMSNHNILNPVQTKINGTKGEDKPILTNNDPIKPTTSTTHPQPFTEKNTNALGWKWRHNDIIKMPQNGFVLKFPNKVWRWTTFLTLSSTYVGNTRKKFCHFFLFFAFLHCTKKEKARLEVRFFS